MSSPTVNTPTTKAPTVDPRIWKRRVAVTREQGRKRLRVVIGALGRRVRSRAAGSLLFTRASSLHAT